MQEEQSRPFGLAGENNRSNNTISSLVSAILPQRDIPMGTLFLLRKSQSASVRAVSYLDMKEWKVLKKIKEGKAETGGSIGNDNTRNSLGGLWIHLIIIS